MEQRCQMRIFRVFLKIYYYFFKSWRRKITLSKATRTICVLTPSWSSRDSSSFLSESESRPAATTIGTLKTGSDSRFLSRSGRGVMRSSILCAETINLHHKRAHGLSYNHRRTRVCRILRRSVFSAGSSWPTSSSTSATSCRNGLPI